MDYGIVVTSLSIELPPVVHMHVNRRLSVRLHFQLHALSPESIELKLYPEISLSRRTNVCSNGPGNMTKLQDGHHAIIRRNP